MTDFIYLYRNDEAGRRDSMGTPEQAQQNMQRWIAWFQQLDSQGHLKDRGQPLDGNGKVVKGKHKTITDGPYVEAKDVIGGFTIVKARDLAHAAHLASDCPILQNGGSVEIRPVMPM